MSNYQVNLTKYEEKLPGTDDMPQCRQPRLVKEFKWITNKIVDALVNDLASYTMAAAKAGIAEKSFYNYMNKGEEALERREKEEEPLTPFDEWYIQFYQAVQDANYEVKKRHLKRIEKAGMDSKHWTANSWILERRFPEEFSKQRGSGSSVTVKTEGPVEFTLNIGDADVQEEKQETIEEADYELIE